MQKKSKTILTAVVTALFVLSVGYFALLAPTTAWFYQQDDKTYDFTFGNFGMTETRQSAEEASITLRGTTRFADAGETLFDEMVHVVRIKASNTGETAGSVRVRVKQGNDELLLDNVAVSESGHNEKNTLKIANNFNRAVELSLTLTASEACTVSKNGTSASLQAGDNTFAFSVAAGSVYKVSNLPDDMDFQLDYASSSDVGSGTILESSVPHDGKSIEFRVSGLKWFVYAPDNDDNASTPVQTAKNALTTMLHAWDSTWPIDYNTLTGETVNNVTTTYTDYDPLNGEAETAYEAYNVRATEALKEFNKGGVTVLPGQSNKDIYVVFWAEYGDLKNTFGVGDTAANRNIETVTFSNLTIELIAAPDIGGTQTTTLTLTNSASAEAKLKLSRWTKDSWTTYSDSTTGSSGVIQIASGESKQIAGLPVGARYKLEIQVAENTAQSVFFTANDAFRDVHDDGKTLTGTLTNGTNTITLQSTPSLGIFNTTSNAASVKVSTWSSSTGDWAEVTGSPISVAGGGASSISLALNTDYKLELQTSSVHFNDSGRATQIIGRITAGSKTFSIVSD